MLRSFKGIIALSLVSLFTIFFIPPVSAEEITPDQWRQAVESGEIKRWEDSVVEEMSKTPMRGDFKTMDRASYGSFSWRDGVICITDSSTWGFNHGHAGIVGIAPHYYMVIEANPDDGVALHYGEWGKKRFSNQKVWQVGVTSTTVQQDHDAAVWADSQVGKKYNWNFLDPYTRKSFYCSQLVYAAYLDTAGVDLNTSKMGQVVLPYELLDNPKVTLIYRNQ